MEQKGTQHHNAGESPHSLRLLARWGSTLQAKSLVPVLGGWLRVACLDSCHKARLGRAAPTTARRRRDPARERRTSGSQASPRCRAPAQSHPLQSTTNRKSSVQMCSRSALVDCGDDLHSNNLLLSLSTLAQLTLGVHISCTIINVFTSMHTALPSVHLSHKTT